MGGALCRSNNSRRSYVSPKVPLRRVITRITNQIWRPSKMTSARRAKFRSRVGRPDISGPTLLSRGWSAPEMGPRRPVAPPRIRRRLRAIAFSMQELSHRAYPRCDEKSQSTWSLPGECGASLGDVSMKEVVSSTRSLPLAHRRAKRLMPSLSSTFDSHDVWLRPRAADSISTVKEAVQGEVEKKNGLNNVQEWFGGGEGGILRREPDLADGRPRREEHANGVRMVRDLNNTQTGLFECEWANSTPTGSNVVADKEQLKGYQGRDYVKAAWLDDILRQGEVSDGVWPAMCLNRTVGSVLIGCPLKEASRLHLMNGDEVIAFEAVSRSGDSRLPCLSQSDRDHDLATTSNVNRGESEKALDKAVGDYLGKEAEGGEMGQGNKSHCVREQKQICRSDERGENCRELAGVGALIGTEVAGVDSADAESRVDGVHSSLVIVGALPKLSLPNVDTVTVTTDAKEKKDDGITKIAQEGNGRMNESKVKPMSMMMKSQNAKNNMGDLISFETEEGTFAVGKANKKHVYFEDEMLSCSLKARDIDDYKAVEGMRPEAGCTESSGSVCSEHKARETITQPMLPIRQKKLAKESKGAVEKPGEAESSAGELQGASKSALRSCQSVERPGEAEISAGELQGASDSAPTSRRSSMTDSLHELEAAIYDMLNASANRLNEWSDEDTPISRKSTVNSETKYQLVHSK